MKTIATAATLMMLTAPTWAHDPTEGRANSQPNTNEPIVLSEAEMDGLTAGGNPQGYWRIADLNDVARSTGGEPPTVTFQWGSSYLK